MDRVVLLATEECRLILFTEAGVAGAFSFIKKRLQQRFFLRNLRKYLRTPILKNICERLLLYLVLIFWSFQYHQKQPPEVFYKKGVYKNLSKFTGKYLCQGFFFKKVAGLRPGTLLKKRLWGRCFPANFENFKNTFLTEHLRTTASVSHLDRLIICRGTLFCDSWIFLLKCKFVLGRLLKVVFLKC